MKLFFALLAGLFLNLSLLSAQPMPKPFKDFFHTEPMITNDAVLLCNPPLLLVYTDIDGHVWDFNAILASGKPIYFFTFSQGSTIGYNEYINGPLLEFYNLHGPPGDSSVMVFVGVTSEIEGDVDCTMPVTTPCYDLSQLPIPTIGFMSCTANDFTVGYQGGLGPNVFRICPNKLFTAFNDYYECNVNNFVDLPELEASIGLCHTNEVDNDAGIMYSYTDSKAANINGRWRPNDAIICNYGNQNLTSANIEVYWGDQLMESYAWAGNLSPFENDTVALGNLYTDGHAKMLTLKTSLPNGVIDERPENDSFLIQIDSAYYLSDADQILHFKLFSEAFGAIGHMGWQLFGESGNELRRGGCHYVYDIEPDIFAPSFRTANYGGSPACDYDGQPDPITPGNIPPDYPLGYSNDSIWDIPIDLSSFSDSCFTFRILWGTGIYPILNFDGDGYGLVTVGADTVLNFTRLESTDHYAVLTRKPAAPITTSVNDYDKHYPLLVRPNPSNDRITFTCNDTVLPVKWEVVDFIGRKLWLSVPNPSTQTQTLDVSQWNTGVYILRLLMPDGQSVVREFEVVH